MSEKSERFNVYLYVPMVMTMAFLLGCLWIALLDIREQTDTLTIEQVSQTDTAASRRDLVQTDVKVDGSLRYRIIRTPESERTDEAQPYVASESPTSSDTSDETVSPSSLVASQLQFSKERHVNLIPPKTGYVAYLTFDDGPSENTDEILDILDYYGVKATFFVIYHANMEDQYKAIVERGHTIALHTYTHQYSKVYKSEAAFLDEMNQIGDYVYSITGVRTKIMRFPGGSSNTVSNKYSKGLMTTLKQSVTAKGYLYHDWNVDTCDATADNLPKATLLANVKKSLPKYTQANILMHDAGQSKQTTVDALPDIIEYVQAQRYHIERLETDSYAVHHNW